MLLKNPSHIELTAIVHVILKACAKVDLAAMLDLSCLAVVDAKI